MGSFQDPLRTPSRAISSVLFNTLRFKGNRSIARTWGTHLGETKLVASTTDRPVSERRLMNSILVSAGITDFSFWRPSRGPTSTILTNRGDTLAGAVYFFLSLEDVEQCRERGKNSDNSLVILPFCMFRKDVLGNRSGCE